MSSHSSTAFAVAVGSAFVLGFGVSSYMHEKDLTDARLEYVKEAKKIEGEFRAKERKQAEELAKALDARDRARASADGLRSRADRVQYELDQTKSRLSAANSRSEEYYRERLSRGAELIGRSSDLLIRSHRVAEKCAIDKDTLVNLQYSGN